MAVAYAQREVMAETLLELRAALREPDYQPPMLPRVALDVMRLSRQTNVTLPKLSRVLEQDPILAAAVLKVAQSPIYARRWEPRTVREALSRLGMRGMRAVVMEAAVRAIPFPPGRWGKLAAGIQKRCVAMGHMSRELARMPETGVDPEEAFLAGLLADVGKPAVLGIISDRSLNLDAEASLAVLEELHADASGLLARTWKLPESIREVLVAHHSLALEGELGRLACVVRVAETVIDLADDGASWTPALLNETGFRRALRGCGLEGVSVTMLRTLGRETLAETR